MSSDVAALQEQRRLVQEVSKRLTCLLIESREQQRYWSRKAADDKAWRRGVGLRILAITPDGTAALQQYLQMQLSGDLQDSIDLEYEDIVQRFRKMTCEDLCSLAEPIAAETVTALLGAANFAVKLRLRS